MRAKMLVAIVLLVGFVGFCPGVSAGLWPSGAFCFWALGRLLWASCGLLGGLGGLGP